MSTDAVLRLPTPARPAWPVRLAGTSLLCWAIGAQAAPLPPIPPGARLAATCAACHGTDGHGAANNAALPPLVGQPRAALASALRGFRDGTRPGGIMPQIAKGYSDEQVAQLAAWFAAQPAGAAK